MCTSLKSLQLAITMIIIKVTIIIIRCQFELVVAAAKRMLPAAI